jgi:selenocysteine lyase/cysteine desulfurase
MGEFEFPTMGHVWLAQQRRGAQVKFVPATDHKISASAYERAVDSRTAIVPVTGVCFMNGVRSDVAAVTRLAHAHGALVMLDDYQDCGTRPVDVKALDVDFYVVGTLKYLLGPAGLAFLYVREELLERLLPSTSGWFRKRTRSRLTFGCLTPPPTPAGFRPVRRRFLTCMLRCLVCN